MRASSFNGAIKTVLILNAFVHGPYKLNASSICMEGLQRIFCLNSLNTYKPTPSLRDSKNVTNFSYRIEFLNQLNLSGT